MKLLKLATITAAVLGSSMAMANDAAQPYQYNSNQGVVANTTGAMMNTGKTLFQTVTHPAAVSAEIGTMGYGANIAWGINESTELQAGWSGMDVDGDTDLNSSDSWINYEKALGDGYENFEGNFAFDAKLSNPYLGVQMRPMSNWLTVGAGVMVPRNEFAATLTADNSTDGFSKVTIDDVDYQIADNSSVSVKLENRNKLAPYATLGFRPNITNKWGGFFEAGAAYMGKVDSEVAVSNGAILNATEEQFVQAAEEELNDNDAIWYPIVKAGVTYRF